MTLFPQLSDTYYVDNDTSILKQMDYTYNKYVTTNMSFWSEADIDHRFHAGDQTLWNDIYGNLPAFRKKNFTFNRIRRTISMMSGYQRQHRKSTIVTPIESSSQQAADQFTKLLYHTNNRASVLETLSEAFQGALVGGMNLLVSWLDYRNDPVNGDICVDNIGYNGYLIDPYFTKMDLSDCNSIWTRKYMSRNQAISLFPSREAEIKDLGACGNRDGKFQFMPESYNYANQDLLIVDEFWYLDSRRKKMIIDTASGECKEWKGTDDTLDDYLKMFPTVIIQEQESPTVKLAVVIQGKVFYNGPNPMGIDRYPHTPVWAYYEPQIPYYPWRLQGVVRGLRDAQYLYNRRRIIELDILESQMTSGFIYKENALVNPKDVFLQGQGKGLALKAEALITDVQRIEPPQVPPSMIQLSELLGKEIQEISGVNEELLGSAEDDKAGVLSMLRQGAGLVTLQPLFDHLDQSQKMLGKLHMELMQANWTPGKITRILGDGEKPVEEFNTRAYGIYDCIVEEGPLTATQKQMALQKAIFLQQAGVPIPPTYLIDQMNLPDKDKLIEGMMQQEKAKAEQEQQMMQLQMQQMHVENETKMSYAEGQQALAIERLNKTKLDAALSAERLQRADEDRTASALNMIKAVKELQGMDLDHIERSLRVVEQLTPEKPALDTKTPSLPARQENIAANSPSM